MVEFDYGSWRTSIENSLDVLLGGFESRFGYEPDENSVGGASSADLLAAAEAVGIIPSVLLDFYRHISEVDLPDVHNGLFVHPLVQVLDNEKNGVPVRAPGLTDESITVFGSDGGGTLFALGAQGAPVFVLPPGAVREGTYSGGLEAPGVFVSTLAEFLEWLRSAVHKFTTDRE